MDYIYEWNGFYYEYTSLQVMPDEVSSEQEDLWDTYYDRKKTLENLIEDIDYYNSNKSHSSDELLKLYIDTVYQDIEKLDLLNKKIGELKKEYNLICDDMPKVISLDNPNLIKRVPRYRWICKNCETQFLNEERQKLYNKDVEIEDHKKIYLCPNCGSHELIYIHPNVFYIEKYYDAAKKEFNNGYLEKGIENGLKCIEEFEQIEPWYDEERISALQDSLSSIFRWVAGGYEDLKMSNKAYQIADKGIKELQTLEKSNRRVIYEDLCWLHRIRLSSANKSNSRSKTDVILNDYKKIIEYIDKIEEQYIEFIENGWASQEQFDVFLENKDMNKLFAYFDGSIKVGEISDDLDTALLIAENGLRYAQNANIDENSKASMINEFEDLIEDIQRVISLRQEQKQVSKGCYVATAVYGSYDCPQVWTLRRFRDYYLLERKCGQLFVKLYYKISPSLVRKFGGYQWFNHIFKKVLDSFVKKLNNNGYTNERYSDD